MASVTASKRMLNNIEGQQQQQKGWSINNKFECIILGDPYCGKSAYLNTLAASEKDSNSPIMISHDKNEFEFWLEHKSMKAIFKVKDTANQERYRSLTQTYYRKAECVLLFFDLNLYESFENLHNWYTDVMNYCKKPEKNFAIILIGLKDQKRQTSISSTVNDLLITRELIEKFQQEHPFIIDYCEISLKAKTNLKEPFELLFENFLSTDKERLLPTSYFDSLSSKTEIKSSSLTKKNSESGTKACKSCTIQ